MAQSGQGTFGAKQDLELSAQIGEPVWRLPDGTLAKKEMFERWLIQQRAAAQASVEAVDVTPVEPTQGPSLLDNILRNFRDRKEIIEGQSE